jgi:hypothetical protein
LGGAELLDVIARIDGLQRALQPIGGPRLPCDDPGFRRVRIDLRALGQIGDLLQRPRRTPTCPDRPVEVFLRRNAPPPLPRIGSRKCRTRR